MKFFILIILFLSFNLNAQNLVPNYSFENLSIDSWHNSTNFETNLNELLYDNSQVTNNFSKDTLRFKNKHSIGLQVLGTTNFAPFYSLEYFIIRKLSLIFQFGISLDINFYPPSIELLPKFGANYYLSKNIAFTTKIGLEQSFNPWYMHDSTSFDFISNCTFGLCPKAATDIYSDIGFQFSFFKHKKLLLAPLLTYVFNQKYSDFKVGPTITLEIKLQL